MSTTEYLSKLNIDQLLFAREEADRRIKEIKDKPRVTVWIVEHITNAACFYEHDFAAAKEKLAEIILSEEFTASDIRHSHPQILKVRLYESEVADYMELNK